MLLIESDPSLPPGYGCKYEQRQHNATDNTNHKAASAGLSFFIALFDFTTADIIEVRKNCVPGAREGACIYLILLYVKIVIACSQRHFHDLTKRFWKSSFIF